MSKTAGLAALRAVVAFLSLMLVTANSYAILTIEITKGVEAALPIAIVPFGWEGADAAPLNVSEVVTADLYRSGQFAPLPEKDMLSKPQETGQVNFRNWRLLGVPNLIIGKVRNTGVKRYSVQFQLFDVYRGQQLKGLNFPVQVPTAISDKDALRKVAHQISDIVYEALTGVRGAFSTRIAYVTKSFKSDGEPLYTLEVADADGENARPILRSKYSMLSPAWSPDGKRIAYVSFEKNRPEIWVQEVGPGTRQRITAYEGLNGAPAWSPDGKRLALTLSKDGNAEVYVYQLSNKKLTRITRHWSIDTEPAWAPDGRSLVFVSERGGRPQLYRFFFADGRVQRLTYEGKQNLRPSFSPDGRLLTFINLSDEGDYRVAVMELDTGLIRVLTDTGLDESPSFAPNGSMIIYATQVNNRGVLAAVSVDGGVQQRFSVKGEGDVREPSWSPFIQ